MRYPDPTPEQPAIIDAFSTGDGVTIVAAAGSGKTTSLRMIAREDAMLAYVTVTRAKLALDRSGLAWADRYTPGAES